VTAAPGRPAGAVPNGVDHLIYIVPDLEEGMETVQDMFGVRPVVGGRHADYGTRNALLSLGPATYLEIMAPDKELASPPKGRLFGLDTLKRPRLAAWILRAEDIESLAARANEAGLGLGEPTPGSRERPDGTVLSWKLTDPYASRMGGVVPFLIAWGDTPHPATQAPIVGSLAGLRIEHPEPKAVSAALNVLGVVMEVREGSAPRLIASIRSGDRTVELR
jgi:hypothetical protein